VGVNAVVAFERVDEHDGHGGVPVLAEGHDPTPMAGEVLAHAVAQRVVVAEHRRYHPVAIMSAHTVVVIRIPEAYP
jgi:hypothetical protein